MTQMDLQDMGFRWTRPTWERKADHSWILIVPTSFTKAEEVGLTTDPRFDRSQRFYEVFSFDGTWIDQLHELQVERLLGASPQNRLHRFGSLN